MSERETLIDILVHGQDPAIPLGLDLARPTEASAAAATRAWATRRTRLPDTASRLTALTPPVGRCA